MTPEVTAVATTTVSNGSAWLQQAGQIILILLGTASAWLATAIANHGPKLVGLAFDFLEKYVKNTHLQKLMFLAEGVASKVIETKTMPMAVAFKKAAEDGKLTPEEITELRKVFKEEFVNAAGAELVEELKGEFPNFDGFIDSIVSMYFKDFVKKN